MSYTKSALQFRPIGIGRIEAVYGEKEIPIAIIIDQPSGVVWSFEAGDVRVIFRRAESQAAARAEILRCLCEWLGAPSALQGAA